MSFVVVDDEEFRKELDEATREFRAAKANEALDVATSIAPRGESGDYVESLEVGDDEVGGEDGTVLGSTDPAGHIIEWGSEDTEPHGTLRKAAEAVGAEVEDEGAP